MSEEMKVIREWMEQALTARKSGVWGRTPQDWRFSCNEELLIQFATEYPKARNLGYPMPKACYHMAYQRAVRKNSPWIYVEGIAFGKRSVMPVNHAWVTREDTPGVAYELAWENAPGGAYFGIQFCRDYIRKIHLGSKRTSYSILQAYWMEYPLLSGKDKIEEVMIHAAR